MSRLLQAERELKKLQAKHDEKNHAEDVKIFLDWSRDGKEKLQLLTIIKNVPKKIAQKFGMKDDRWSFYDEKKRH